MPAREWIFSGDDRELGEGQFPVIAIGGAAVDQDVYAVGGSWASLRGNKTVYPLDYQFCNCQTSFAEFTVRRKIRQNVPKWIFGRQVYSIEKIAVLFVNTNIAISATSRATSTVYSL